MSNPPASINVRASPGFVDWLTAHRVSLAVTTHSAGLLLLIGARPDGALSIFSRGIGRCSGLHVEGTALYVAAEFQVWHYEAVSRLGASFGDWDPVYAPRVAYLTADLNVHDIALDAAGRLILTNPQFNCLATTDGEYSFIPLWKPPFVADIVSPDRCHLNGLATRDGHPAFVTVRALTDEENMLDRLAPGGGAVLSLPSGEPVVRGLTAPHSPRLHRGRLWLLNTGLGELGVADPDGGAFEPVAFCPGYARGLDFVGNWAVVGLSKPRDLAKFEGMGLSEALSRRGKNPVCGIHVLNTGTGALEQWLEFDGPIREVADLRVMRDARRPMVLAMRGEELRAATTFEPRDGDWVG